LRAKNTWTCVFGWVFALDLTGQLYSQTSWLGLERDTSKKKGNHEVERETKKKRKEGKRRKSSNPLSKRPG